MVSIYKAVVSIQKMIHDKTGQRTDAHYQEGQGALFVPENAPLTRQNVIYAAPEMELIMRGM